MSTLKNDNLVVRPLLAADLDAADKIMRTAFGTFLGMPQPENFMGDAAYVAPRWKQSPESAFVAVENERVVGSNFATCWGSVGFLGPLTVSPDRWDCGIGRRLMEPVMQCFEAWRVAHAGLFTFAHSPKHVGFYQTLGFWPRHLTAVLARPAWTPPTAPRFRRFSETTGVARSECLAACAKLTDSIYPGLDVGSEIESVCTFGLGETLLIDDEEPSLAGLATCHVGPGTEAGSRTMYLKFGAVRGGSGAAERFERLLDTCAAYAATVGADNVLAGVSTARHAAYRTLLGRRFRTVLQGVTMHRPNEAGYSRPDAFVLDDWR